MVFDGLGKDLNLVAGLFVGASEVVLKLFDGSLQLSFLPDPILMVLLDGKIVLLLKFADVLTVAGFVIVLLVHSVFVDVVDGLLKLGDSL